MRNILQTRIDIRKELLRTETSSILIVAHQEIIKELEYLINMISDDID